MPRSSRSSRSSRRWRGTSAPESRRPGGSSPRSGSSRIGVASAVRSRSPSAARCGPRSGARRTRPCARIAAQLHTRAVSEAGESPAGSRHRDGALTPNSGRLTSRSRPRHLRVKGVRSGGQQVLASILPRPPSSPTRRRFRVLVRQWLTTSSDAASDDVQHRVDGHAYRRVPRHRHRLPRHVRHDPEAARAHRRHRAVAHRVPLRPRGGGAGRGGGGALPPGRRAGRAGGGGWDDFSDVPAEAKAKEKIGGVKPNVEKIVALRSDLVLSLRISDGSLERIAAQNIPVLVIDPPSLSDAARTAVVLGTAIGADGATLARSIDEGIAAVRAKAAGVAKKRVFHEVDASDPTKLFTAGPGSFIHHLIHVAR